MGLYVGNAVRSRRDGTLAVAQTDEKMACVPRFSKAYPFLG